MQNLIQSTVFGCLYVGQQQTLDSQDLKIGEA